MRPCAVAGTPALARATRWMSGPPRWLSSRTPSWSGAARPSFATQHPVDIQLEYYTGEAAFALATVQRLSGDPRDLDAASRALAFLVKRSRWYVGAHYFWAAEHWTCQALAELWDRAPDRLALQFCLAWQAANREVQLTLAGPHDGGISRGPFVSPRLTPLASRMEAAVATLATARKAGVAIEEQQLLETEIRR